MQTKTKSERKTRTVVDTISFNEKDARTWLTPPFQRPIKVNRKVMLLADDIAASGGVIPGMLTLGKIDGKTYKVDGQHRIEAACISGAKEFYADVRYLFLDSVEEMGEEFVRLNSSLVRMTPDDILRGLEGGMPLMRKIKENLFFITYNTPRRKAGEQSTISMSAALVCWAASAPETPGTSGTALAIAQTMDEEFVDGLIAFMSCCCDAWGRDFEYARLWGRCNLITCAWLYRRTVFSGTQRSNKTVRLNRDQFTKCLMSLSANDKYLEWVRGRLYNDMSRAPCYSRVTTLFAPRIVEMTGKKPLFPRPPWALGKVNRV
jgi:hypothetical protein